MLIEGHESSRIALPQQNQRQRRGQSIRVRALGQAFGRTLPRHGSTRVDQDHGAEIRLFFELLYEQSIGAPQDPPVEILQLIPRLVGAVLGELDREPAEGRPMQPGQEPLNDALGDDLDATEVRDFGRIEQV